MPRTKRGHGNRQEEKRLLMELSADQDIDSRVRSRAKMILRRMTGLSPEHVAEEMGISRSVVFRWCVRYEEEGIQGLWDKPRTGKPRVYDAAFEQQALALLDQEPPAPFPYWTASALATQMEASPDAIWRLLRRQGISLSRQRIWKVPVEVELQPWERELTGIYMSPPYWIAVSSAAGQNVRPGMLYSWDKATGVALRAAVGNRTFLPMEDAMRLMTQQQASGMSDHRRKESVLNFLNDILRAFPSDCTLVLHAVGDVRAALPADWQKEHPQMQFHLYPSKQAGLDAIARLPYVHGQDVQALLERVDRYPADAHPFVWKKF